MTLWHEIFDKNRSSHKGIYIPYFQNNHEYVGGAKRATVQKRKKDQGGFNPPLPTYFIKIKREREIEAPSLSVHCTKNSSYFLPNFLFWPVCNAVTQLSQFSLFGVQHTEWIKRLMHFQLADSDFPSNLFSRKKTISAKQIYAGMSGS
jgi:hypothetical protein